MKCNGWELKNIDKLLTTNLIGEMDKAKIPIRPMPHLAFRWTYRDILRGIIEKQQEALILTDDMCLPYLPSAYQQQIEMMKS